MSEHAADDHIARAWLAHLMAGGVTEWLPFRAAAAPEAPREPQDWPGVLPGAQNLEVLRRLNSLGPVSHTLAREVLGASLPGRGKPDLRLPGAVPPRWGHPAEDPSALSDAELLRVVTGVLTDRLSRAALPATTEPRARRWARPFELRGNPWEVHQALDALRARGRVPGGSGATVVLVAGPLDELMAAQWARRVHRTAMPDWASWLNGLQRKRAVPPPVDLPAVAAAAAARVGRRRVHVVFDPAAVGPLVGWRRLPAAETVPSWPVGEVTRLVSAALMSRVAPEQRHRLLWEAWRPHVAAVAAAASGSAAPVPVTGSQHAWLTRRAGRMADQIAAAGYSVHGDLSSLMPATAPRRDAATAENDARTLTLGLRLLADPAGGAPSTTPDNGE